jgi:uncharacterized protein
MEKKFLQTKFELKGLTEEGTFEGYGSVFGVVDAYEEVVAPGAFQASLAFHKANGTMPKLLWQHNAREPIGVFTEMSEDGKGLLVRGKICLETQTGKEAYALLKMGAVDGLSIGFFTKRYEYDRETGIMTLLEIDLWEVSVVTFPANGDARIDGVKADLPKTPRDFEKFLRDQGFPKAMARGITGKGFEAGRDAQEPDADTAGLNGRDAQNGLKQLQDALQNLSQTIQT